MVSIGVIMMKPFLSRLGTGLKKAFTLFLSLTRIYVKKKISNETIVKIIS